MPAASIHNFIPTDYIFRQISRQNRLMGTHRPRTSQQQHKHPNPHPPRHFYEDSALGLVVQMPRPSLDPLLSNATNHLVGRQRIGSLASPVYGKKPDSVRSDRRGATTTSKITPPKAWLLPQSLLLSGLKAGKNLLGSIHNRQFGRPLRKPIRPLRTINPSSSPSERRTSFLESCRREGHAL